MEKIFSKLNINIEKEKLEKLLEFLNIFLEWNSKINLSGLKEKDDILEKHFVDSIFLNKFLKDGKAIDIGTGGGFPGMILAIINPHISFTLVDSINKKTNFLMEVKEKLNLKNVEIINSRAEDLSKNLRETFDYAFARAVGKLNNILEYIIPYLKVEGIFIAQKGPNFEEEVLDSQNALAVLNSKIINIEKFILPNSNQERVSIIIKKMKESNEKFPRKSSLILKKPL